MADQQIVIVTGSSGLIGYPVAERFAQAGIAVGFDRAGPPHPPPGAHCVSVDVTSDESLDRALRIVRDSYGARITSVIHLAAYYDFSGEPSPKYEEVTVRGTERLLRALQTFHVEQFVFSSTMLVHAPCEPGQYIDEEWPLDPRWPYPQSKAKTEQVVQSVRGRIPVVLMRIAGVYDDYCHSVPLAHQIQRIYERRLVSHVFPGHIAHGQALVHLDDVVQALVRVVDRRMELPPVLPVLTGEPETVSYDELQHTFGRLIHGEEWETREIPKAVARAGAWVQDAAPFGEDPFIKPWMIDFADDHYALDMSRARDVIGWTPKHSLRQTLPEMVAALKASPATWYRDHHLKLPSWLEESEDPEAAPR